MKQIYKNKIREIRHLAMLGKVDIQTISDVIVKELEQVEDKIVALEMKDWLTDIQKEKLHSLQNEYQELETYNDKINDIIMALEDLEQSTYFID